MLVDHQVIHVSAIERGPDRADLFRARCHADADFMTFAKQIRPLLMTQENKLLFGAPWGPNP